jgi:hypothetical protein
MRVGGNVASEFHFTPYFLYASMNYFGEWECVYPHPRAGGVRVEMTCVLHLLPRTCFVDTANEVPQLLEHFRRKAQRREERRRHRLLNHKHPKIVVDLESFAATIIQAAFRARVRAQKRRKVNNRLSTLRAIKSTITLGTPTAKTPDGEQPKGPFSTLNAPNPAASSPAAPNGLPNSATLPPDATPTSGATPTQDDQSTEIVATPTKTTSQSFFSVRTPSKEAPAQVVFEKTSPDQTGLEQQLNQLKATVDRIEGTQRDMQLMMQQLYLMSSKREIKDDL